MPKIVCSKCQLKLLCVKVGVSVVRYADGVPYELWNADEYECTGCHVKVVAGFSDRVLREHGFAEDIWAIPDEYKRRYYDDAEQRDKFKKAVRDV